MIRLRNLGNKTKRKGMNESIVAGHQVYIADMLATNTVEKKRRGIIERSRRRQSARSGKHGVGRVDGQVTRDKCERRSDMAIAMAKSPRMK